MTISKLIAQARILAIIDEKNSDRHKMVLDALKRLKSRKKQFGPRFGDDRHKPTNW